jgi:hypothetical protein
VGGERHEPLRRQRATPPLRFAAKDAEAILASRATFIRISSGIIDNIVALKSALPVRPVVGALLKVRRGTSDPTGPLKAAAAAQRIIGRANVVNSCYSLPSARTVLPLQALRARTVMQLFCQDLWLPYLSAASFTFSSWQLISRNRHNAGYRSQFLKSQVPVSSRIVEFEHRRHHA